jgi:type III restriction enzyme
VSQVVNSLTGRMSLRVPQRVALERLARFSEIVGLDRNRDPAAALAATSAEFPTVTDFERTFPSVCFALATGVGKTRLMGAFIAYLRQVHNARHFFVLAPNLTIYDKLIREFSPGDRKHVFQGVAEFATNPPELITGDNYESGRATRSQGDAFGDRETHVNIFNISKINSEVRGGRAPRIKRLQEYIGSSYFDYLAGLDDLVLIMDESHRYRASAGVKVLNELNPVLGLELTATPQVESARGAVPFKNVIYSYPLAEAIRDGYVKEPAVATRANFDARGAEPAALERIKLEDAIHIHENVKVELETYANQTGSEIVKPFVLVIARDITHAAELRTLIESNEFFAGRYKGKVIEVHSRQGAEERDETVQRLLAVEKRDEPTEIVVHVNMLKEGWDVTNLYTIVPLRAADSRTLVEQSIGRGLRLPYGRKTGVPAVDRLTIVAHDRFQEIVDAANEPGSAIKVEIIEVGRDIPLHVRAETVSSTFAAHVAVVVAETQLADAAISEQDRDVIVRATLEAMDSAAHTGFGYSPGSEEQVKRAVHGRLAQHQMELSEGLVYQTDELIGKILESLPSYSMRIPDIRVVPRGEVSAGFTDFDLDTSGIHQQPVSHDILVQHLQSNARHMLLGTNAMSEEVLENYIVRPLLERDEVDYTRDRNLLFKLAGQLVRHLRGYLSEDDTRNVLQFHQRTLVKLVASQLLTRYSATAAGYDVQVNSGYMIFPPLSFSAAEEVDRNFRAPVDNRSSIRGMVFTGFRRCLYPRLKFDSDAERRFAVLLEDDGAVQKWVRPPSGIPRIEYDARPYEPDFIVETAGGMFLCEVKADRSMNDQDVLDKARAAVEWCQHATRHASTSGSKPWNYLLVNERRIDGARTFGSVIEEDTYRIR